MADYAPVSGGDLADYITMTAGAAITGGNVLVVSGVDSASPCAVNPANFLGVAAHDAASGAAVTVIIGAGVVHETPASAGTTSAGVPLYAGAGGKITGTAGTGYGAIAVGVALRTTGTADQALRWKTLVG